MSALETILDEINRKYGFIATVLVRRNGEIVARVGDPREPVFDDPYNIFFRDKETIANAFEYLATQGPPQVHAQGDRSVALFKPREDLLLGAVKEDSRDAIEMFHLTQKLNQELPAWFEGIDFDAP